MKDFSSCWTMAVKNT